jgi:VanZ family protein
VTARFLFGLSVLAQVVVLYAPGAAGSLAVPYVDKAVHVAVFAAVVVAGRRVGLPLWLLIGGSVVQAVVSEVAQTALLPDRTGEPADVLADLAGVALGVLLSRTRLGKDSAVEGARGGSIDPETSNRHGRRHDR